MAPPSRRRILPPETLSAFGATALYPPLKSVSHGASSIPTPPTTAPQNSTSAIEADEVIQPNGIQVGGWRITTQNSTIGDEKRMEDLTVLLEEIANGAAEKVDMNNSGEAGKNNQCSTKKKRRLCPPEITFLDAIISFQYQKDSTSNNHNIEDSNNGSEADAATAEVRFTAQDALLEWAEAHRNLDLHQREEQISTQSSVASAASSHDVEYRGVSIIRTVDAKIWSNKRPQSNNSMDATANAAAVSGKSEFYYDWTFSSPYAGTIIQSIHGNAENNNQERESKEDIIINNRNKWQPLQQSHIPFHLLTDTTQPILLYDDIHLYEDDLHDNGDVSLNVKVRVMPRCWYVLQRLFVRVDYVCVRCREVRYFCLFDEENNYNVGSSSGDNDNKEVRPNVVYRDVVWREAPWEELSGLGLPTDPAAWRENDGTSPVAGAGMPPPLASLLMRLPVKPLPSDLPGFSRFEAH